MVVLLEMLRTILGEVIEHRPFCYVLHDISHLFNRPWLLSKIETATLELSIPFVMQVSLVQLTEHGHGSDSIQDRRLVLKVTPVAKANERRDALAHQRRPKTDKILAKTLNSIPSCLSWAPLSNTQVICSLVLHLGNKNGISQSIIRLPMDTKYPSVWTNRAAFKVIMKFNIRIGLAKLCYNVFQAPFRFVDQRYFL